ncbi:hypothetical protein [Marinomonas transparens]|uniref:Uncharacterized protein n=1 Tax=Marinomonas transparens TaxID=2795388 RepID=A0A934JTI2_9GAMM|nr:hypothetical protein [Marinomonas transparens]MBJ7538041.1 hypothetical protein [Marinomonas transparens]
MKIKTLHAVPMISIVHVAVTILIVVRIMIAASAVNVIVGKKNRPAVNPFDWGSHGDP